MLDHRHLMDSFFNWTPYPLVRLEVHRDFDPLSYRTVGADYDGDFKTFLRAEACGALTDERMADLVADTLRARRKTRPTKVIVNDPAVVVYFSDKTRVVTKCHDGDEFDATIGVLAVALRKSSNNRARIDDWEEVLREIAEFGPEPSGMRAVAKALDMKAPGILNNELYLVRILPEKDAKTLSSALSLAADILEVIGDGV